MKPNEIVENVQKKYIYFVIIERFNIHKYGFLINVRKKSSINYAILVDMLVIVIYIIHTTCRQHEGMNVALQTYLHIVQTAYAFCKYIPNFHREEKK